MNRYSLLRRGVARPELAFVAKPIPATRTGPRVRRGSQQAAAAGLTLVILRGWRKGGEEFGARAIQPEFVIVSLLKASDFT
jgi:hypothetical protein